MNWRVHAISLLVLLLVVGTSKFIWDNPKVILYVVLGGIALLAYGAIYLIVKTKFESREKK